MSSKQMSNREIRKAFFLFLLALVAFLALTNGKTTDTQPIYTRTAGVFFLLVLSSIYSLYLSIRTSEGILSAVLFLLVLTLILIASVLALSAIEP